MREELMDHCNESYSQSCINQLNDFVDLIHDSYLSGSRLDDSVIEQAKAKANHDLEAAQDQIKKIGKMSDSEVKQLYYQTFRRWHPNS